MENELDPKFFRLNHFLNLYSGVKTICRAFFRNVTGSIVCYRKYTSIVCNENKKKHVGQNNAVLLAPHLVTFPVYLLHYCLKS